MAKKRKHASDSCSQKAKSDEKNNACYCETCVNWFHLRCIGVPDNIYDFMKNDHKSNCFSYNCPECKKYFKAAIHRDIKFTAV